MTAILDMFMAQRKELERYRRKYGALPSPSSSGDEGEDEDDDDGDDPDTEEGSDTEQEL
jgi:adenylate cyclase